MIVNPNVIGSDVFESHSWRPVYGGQYVTGPPSQP